MCHGVPCHHRTILRKKKSCRVASRLTVDHISALFPDVESPFRDIEDVVDRLLPYHVFQHPREDLLKIGKGKQKATETDILRSELEGAPLRRARCLVFAHSAFRNKICTGVLQAPTSTGGTLSSCQDEIWQGMLCYIYSQTLSLTAYHITSAQRPMTKRITLNDKCSNVSAPSIPH